jgi:hypothetical protein
MFERFTHAARETVVRARQEALDLGHPAIGTEHLLLALLADGNPAAAVLHQHAVTRSAVLARLSRIAYRDEPLGELDAEALHAIGIDLDAVRDRIEGTFGPAALGPAGPRPGPKRTRLRFSPRAKHVLELALREARTLRHTHLGSEHLLLGLLREGEGLAAKVLHDLEVNLPALRRAVTAGLERAA